MASESTWYVETNEPDVFGFLPDGRKVVVLSGKRLVMPYEAHISAINAALAAKVEYEKAQREAGSTVQEAIAVATCPQMQNGKPCGGTLNRAPVCPSCVTGRMGYRYRYTCDSCGCDIVTREELR